MKIITASESMIDGELSLTILKTDKSSSSTSMM
nr:MAG TPA: hypothetical protein [Caudoviricetes sp.]